MCQKRFWSLDPFWCRIAVIFNGVISSAREGRAIELAWDICFLILWTKQSAGIKQALMEIEICKEY